MEVIIISGLSGSGKSIALNALEDNDFYCIDNLPVTLLSNISQHLNHEHQDKVAISVDIRSIDIEKLPFVIKEIPKPVDSTDALALAICHHWRGVGNARLATAKKKATKKR